MRAITHIQTPSTLAVSLHPVKDDALGISPPPRARPPHASPRYHPRRRCELWLFMGGKAGEAEGGVEGRAGLSFWLYSLFALLASSVFLIWRAPKIGSFWRSFYIFVIGGRLDCKVYFGINNLLSNRNYHSWSCLFNTKISLPKARVLINQGRA